MNYNELSKIPNPLDKMNITNNMIGSAYFDKVSPIDNFSRLGNYINNLKTLYPHITEKELDDMFKEFKQEVEKQHKMEEAARLARRIDAS